MADFKEGAEVRIRNEPDVVGFEVGGLAMTLGQPVKVVTFRDRGATVIKDDPSRSSKEPEVTIEIVTKVVIEKKFLYEL